MRQIKLSGGSGRKLMSFRSWLAKTPRAQVIFAGIKDQQSIGDIARRLGISGQAVQRQVKRWHKELGLGTSTYDYRKIRMAKIYSQRLQQLETVKDQMLKELTADNENCPIGLRVVFAACQKAGLDFQLLVNEKSGAAYLHSGGGSHSSERSLSCYVNRRLVLISGLACRIHLATRPQQFNPVGKTKHWSFSVGHSRVKQCAYFILVTPAGELFTIPASIIKARNRNHLGRVSIYIPEDDRVWSSNGKQTRSHCAWFRYRGFPAKFFQSVKPERQ